MTTLLAMAVSIAEESGFEPAPTRIIGSSEETHRRLLRAIQRGGEMTARAHDWSILQTEYTFSTAASDGSYDLPAGVRHLLGGSAWNRTQYWEMRGSLSPREWQVRKSALGAQVGLRDRFRVSLGTAAKTLRIDPVPAGVESLVVEYVTNNWIGGGTLNAFAADTDEPDIDSWLVELAGLWIFKRAIGEPYADERYDWEQQVELAWSRDMLPPPLSFAADPVMENYGPFANVPDRGFGS